MNIIEAAKAVLAELDKFGEIDKCHDAILVEALRKAVADAEGMVLVPSEPTDELLSAMASANTPDRQDDFGTAQDIYQALLATQDIYRGMIAKAKGKP